MAEVRRCPACGNPVLDEERTSGETVCSPLRCGAWKVVAKWDRKDRRWVIATADPVEGNGLDE